MSASARAHPRYAELAVATNFSFLRGASHPEELVATAISLKLAGIGIADRNSLAGVVRAHLFLRNNKEQAGDFRVITGARLVFRDGTPDILAYPRDRAAYGRLTRLLTDGNRHAPKGECHLTRDDLFKYIDGLQLIVMNTGEPDDAELLAKLSDAPGRVWLAASASYGRNMRADLARRATLARTHHLPLLATNDILMHAPERRALADVVACIREGVSLDNAGFLLEASAERHLKDSREMARLFEDMPDALIETIRFLDGIGFSLDQLQYDYPDELRAGYTTEQDALEALARQGAARRYAGEVPQKIETEIAKELDFVATKKYPAYFLTVYDIVRFAREKGILAQGRGSAANSVICYCLGITEVDPNVHDLLFERFVSDARNEPPDIDVDFEHERREEVIQYIYEKYGRERAGLAASVVTYRARSAIREVGKVFGLSEDMVSALSGTVWGWWSGTIDDVETKRLGFDPREPRLARAIALAGELAGFPRHLSQHTGGFVITRTRLDEVVPIANAAMEDRTTVEWDKDDLDALKILKIDVLGLGMLTVLRKGFELLERHYGFRPALATIPPEDPRVYAMIERADTIGVFQIESRAQMSMLPRLKPASFYDLVIEVAIVRPGPIQGDMVHPYLRRREGKEPVVYPSKELEDVLGKTLGVPLFQEQAMRIAIVAAGFTPAEADELRRAMATFKRAGSIGELKTKMIEGMVAKNYPREFAERCFQQIEGFGTYGFPESHAASFANLVYASAWMKCRYPDVFAAAILNSQPMGFYAPAQLVRDARDHGIEMREVDINESEWDHRLEQFAEGGSRGVLHLRHSSMRDDIRSIYAVRLGFRQIKGLEQTESELLVKLRNRGYDSVRDLWLRTGLPPSVLERLAEADAFSSLGLSRRDALWAVRGLNRAGDKDDLPLLRGLAFTPLEPDAHLPSMPPGEEVVEDYRHLTLSLKAHPVSFVRQHLAARNILPASALATIDTTKRPRISVGGLVLVRQRPGSASGVIFMTLEDETGVVNIIVWPKVYERLRALVIGARFIAVTGRLQNESSVIHVIADQMEDLTPLLGLLSGRGAGLSALARADEVKRPQNLRVKADIAAHAQRLVQAEMQSEMREMLPKGRNFH
ncbi:MAG: error-prone polymerase [Methylobacteriaceae bacterium]|jgi:error-prone DNA polymerase|nr:error-prone polymerase [Methylobacteriaceae bacterium]